VTRDLIMESILYNTTDARIEMGETAEYLPEGN
jgi:hypothetical protein